MGRLPSGSMRASFHCQEVCIYSSFKGGENHFGVLQAFFYALTTRQLCICV